MSFDKGHKKVGGRTKGTPNKTTADIRNNVQFLIESNLPKMQKWIDATAEENPSKAIDIMIKLTDYVLPKLKSIEVVDNSEEKPFDWPVMKWAE